MRYLDTHGKHITFTKSGNVVGTLCYLSAFGHLGIHASRRDYLISLGYLLIHLLIGELPWTNLKGEMNEVLRKMLIMKSSLNFEMTYKNLPVEFYQYINYVGNLAFYQKPDYGYLEGILLKELGNLREKEDGAFDWVKEPHKKGIDLEEGKFWRKA